MGATSVTATYFTGATFSGGTFYGTHSGVASLTSGTFTGTSVGATSMQATSFTGGTFYGAASLTNIIIPGSTATNGYYLQTTGTSVQWAAAVSPPITGGTTNAIAYATGATTLSTAPGIILTNPTLSGGTVVFTCSGDIVAYSDKTIKTNIEKIPDALNKVCKIGGYTFNRVDGGSVRRTGVIAQEVEEILPEAVYITEGGILTVAYGNMVGLLVEAIKELKQKLDLLSTVSSLE